MEYALKLKPYFERIQSLDPQLHAFISKTDSSYWVSQNDSGPLAGQPFSLKDIWDVAGLPTTGGSVRFRDKIANESGPVAKAFLESGAILLGKTSLSDLSVAPEAANYLVGYTKNPFDSKRTAGGSSGGAAVAVATTMVDFDWGSDIGGSIRVPASHCGVFGLRLSTRNWPVEGIIPKIPPSLKSMCGQGPLTRTVAQMKSVLTAVSPKLEMKINSSYPPMSECVLWNPDIRGEWPTFTEETQAVLKKKLGLDAQVDQGLPTLKKARNIYFEMWGSHFFELFDSDKTLSTFEAVIAVLSAVFFRGVFGDRRIFPSTAELFLGMMLSRFTIFRNPERARQKQTFFNESLEKVWRAGKVIILPTSLYSAPKLGWTTRNPHILSCVVAANLADAAALSIPFGSFPNGLPRGLQLVGPPGSEFQLLEWAEKIAQ